VPPIIKGDMREEIDIDEVKGLKERKVGSNLPTKPYRKPTSNSSIPRARLRGIKKQARLKGILYQSTTYGKAIYKIKDWLTPITNIFRLPADKI